MQQFNLTRVYDIINTEEELENVNCENDVDEFAAKKRGQIKIK